LRQILRLEEEIYLRGGVLCVLHWEKKERKNQKTTILKMLKKKNLTEIVYCCAKSGVFFNP